jgi:hypothetical protein
MKDRQSKKKDEVTYFVLRFLTGKVLTVPIFFTDIVLTVLRFLTEIVVPIFFTEIVPMAEYLY